MRITRTQDVVGAEITDIDLARLSDEDFGRIEQAFNEHAVLCFRGQKLDEEHLIAFARRLGPIEENWLKHYTHPRYPEILFVSNIRENGRDIGHADAGSVWHTDQSFTPRPPRATMLYALEVPTENGIALGSTQFASAADAYDSLPEATQRRIAGLRVIHNLAGRRARTGTGAQSDQALRRDKPDVVHPLVRTHPDTGTKAVWFHKSKTETVTGLTPEETQEFLQDLTDKITQPQFCYAHQYQPGDLLIIDDRASLHKAGFAADPNQHRRLYRMLVRGNRPH